MSNRVVCDISMPADGYLAGPGQTADKPFGDGPVDRLHAWMFDTPEENQAEAERITAAGAELTPFRIDIPQADLDDLADRLARTRRPVRQRRDERPVHRDTTAPP